MSPVFNPSWILLALYYRPSVSFTSETSGRTSGAERGRVHEEKRNPKQIRPKKTIIPPWTGLSKAAMSQRESFRQRRPRPGQSG